MQKSSYTTEEKEIARMYYEQMDTDAFISPAEIVEHPPVALSKGRYSYGDKVYPKPIVTYGNFAFVHAPPKSMKSFFISLMAGVYLGTDSCYGDDMKGHRGKKKLLHFDTEMSDFHASRSFKVPLKISDCCEEDYITYALRRYSPQDRVGFIEYVLYEKYNRDDVGMVIIDGIADLITDNNSLEQSNWIVQKLMTWTQELGISIITVVHSNFGSDKPTGHLGSFLEKKAETQIMLEKNSQVKGNMIVKCKRSRNKSFDDFSFQIDQNGTPFVIETEELNDIFRD